MIENQLLENALRQVSMHSYDDNAEWQAEVWRATHIEEDFIVKRSLRGGGFTNQDQRRKRTAEETKSSVPAKKAKNQYTAKKKAEYDTRKRKR